MSFQAPTVGQLEYTPLFKILNAMVAATDWLGLPVGKLDADSILIAARRKTGLEDWGDEAFVERMRCVLEWASDAGMTPLGRAFMRASAITAVRNRLRMEAYISRFPEVEEIEIRNPIFIVGFPRTGTTLLQNLLTLEEGNRALEFWELTQPVPVSDDPVVDRKKRLAEASLMLKLAYWAAPEMRAIHEVDVHSTEECWYLFQNTFAVLNNDLMSGARAIGDALMASDMTEPYREYRRQLCLLAHRSSFDRYVLKCPEHLWFLDDLLKVFPDACIMWTHRDPVSSVASYSSLISLQWRVLYGKIEPPVIGEHISMRFAQGVERAMAVRDSRGTPERFYDIDFATLADTPMEVVKQAKAHFGMPHSAECEAAMQLWLETERGDKRGAHKYSTEQFGIVPDQTRARFASYSERFGLDPEN